MKPARAGVTDQITEERVKFSEDSAITVVVTSCGRFDLLKKTLESFDRFNTAPIRGVLITEDAGDEAVHGAIPEHWRPHTRVFVNRPRRWQLASIDLAYAEVRTEYVFHLEDDWEFYRAGFVEDSLVLLEVFPRVCTVWLRSFAHDLRCHYPWYALGEREVVQGVRHHRVLSSNPQWSGFSLNPGLRRLRDYTAAAPYAPFGTEQALSTHYGGLGFYALTLEADAILHLGWDAHVSSNKDGRTRRRILRQTLTYACSGLLLGLVLGLVLGAWLS